VIKRRLVSESNEEEYCGVLCSWVEESLGLKGAFSILITSNTYRVHGVSRVQNPFCVMTTIIDLSSLCSFTPPITTETTSAGNSWSTDSYGDPMIARLLHPHSLQLTLRTPFPQRNNQLPKLTITPHILKQAINLLHIQPMHTPTHDRLDLLLPHKLYHIGEFFPRAHGGAAHFDVTQDGGHEEGHFGRCGHTINGYDASGLEGLAPTYMQRLGNMS
jgi:hypothetical protein